MQTLSKETEVNIMGFMQVMQLLLRGVHSRTTMAL
jgi:hypothetical protein